MHGDDKQGQLSVAVELPKLVWALVRYRVGRFAVPLALSNVGRYKEYLDMQPGDPLCAFLFGSTRQSAVQGRAGPPTTLESRSTKDP